MVGTVILKDFETGSYEYMRVTVYSGNSYADMDRQDSFSSCLVSPEKRSVTYDLVVGEDAPRLTMHALFNLCQRVRQYFYKHDWVTIVDFCIGENDISLRTRSDKSGIFAPVDVRTLFDSKTFRIYKLCMESAESYLSLSIRCAVVNYCLKMIFDIEDDVFGISGKGVYIDVSLFKFCRRSVDFLSIPRDILKKVNVKGAKVPKLNFDYSKDLNVEFTESDFPHMNLIAHWRSFKLRTHAQMCEKYHGCDMCPAQIGLDILENGGIKRKAEEFIHNLTELIENYEFCFEAKSHINYISIEDALHILSDIDASDEIAKRAAAMSANMKLRKRLPCADYYDSHGRAYNI